MTEKRFEFREVTLNGMILPYVYDKQTEEYLTPVECADLLNELCEIDKRLRKQIYLIHMSSMFSTVKSFDGDVSQRYKYSDETDTIYDTANNYGSYYKILEKKEIAMLLNEYETLLKELEND